MRKKLLKLASVILVLVIAVTSLAVTASAQTDYSVSTLTIEKIKNPLYSEQQETASAPITITPKRYYAKGLPFDIEICTDNDQEIALDIRETMVNRDKTVDIYYTSDIRHTSESLKEVLFEWLELAFEETENAYEGDFLRYIYSEYGSGQITVLSYPQKHYYHIPLEIGYYTTKAQEEELNAQLKRVIDSFGFNNATTSRQKSDVIYEYITDNVVYDDANLNDESYTLKYSAYAALINKTAVCQGYATLYYRLARECGLDVRVVTGTSRGENHAWNIVKMGDLYYYLDSTWDAGKTIYDYYLKGSTSFTTDHTPEDKYSQAEFTQKYPISATDMNLSDDGYSELYNYEVYLGKAIITRYKGNEKHIVVPAYLDGYPVERIGKKVFSHNDNIESITFSEGIKYIESETIVQCNGLKQINFPASMLVNYEKYGDTALGGYSAVPAYCNNIETLTVASGDNAKMKVVDGILYSADGTGLIMCPPKYNKTKVTIPNGVTTIAPSAFYGCENIKEVVMPDTVKYIGYWAFCTAYNLEKINISKDCRIIGQFAFASTNLTEIYIPASVETILGAAFGLECDLKKITVDPQNENFYMQNGALIYHNKEFDTRGVIDYETDNAATTYTLPANVGIIEQSAFAHAQNLEEIKLHDNVEYIWHYAFENCDSLTHFEFPKGIETVCGGILDNCDNIMSVVIPDSATVIEDMLASGNDGYTIYGKSGSIAQTYAANNQIKFKDIDEFVCTNGHTVQKHFENEYTYYNVCTVCGDRAMTQYLNIIESLAYVAKVEYEYYTYTGKEIKPKIAVFKGANGEPMVEGVDYKILGYYDNINAGYGYIEVQGIGNYAGKGQISFEIKPIHISKKRIGIEYLSTYYDGYEKCPIIEIEGLQEFENFEVTYSNNIEVGTATVTINAWGNYEGTVIITFEIIQPVFGAQLIEEGGKYYYYYNGVKQTEFTDLVKIEGVWYYIEEGVWASNIDKLHKINGNWFLIKKGIWKATTGLVEYQGKMFYVVGGKWKSRNDLFKIKGKWHLIQGGKWDSSIDSLHKLNNKWFLVKNGIWNPITGIVEYKNKEFFVQGGKWKSQETLYKKGGKLLAIKGGKWYKGKGIVKYNGKKYYVNKGYAQISYSGKVTISGKKYTVKKGIVK